MSVFDLGQRKGRYVGKRKDGSDGDKAHLAGITLVHNIIVGLWHVLSALHGIDRVSGKVSR